MNTTRCIFILTTNYIAELDRGLLDRCILVEMNAAKSEQLLPLAHKLAAKQGVMMADEELLPTIKAANGSFRNITHNVERLVRRRNTPSNIIF